MKPEPSEVASRVTGWPSSPCCCSWKRLKNSSSGLPLPPPVPGLRLRPLPISTFWVVETLTTAGARRAVRSAKLIGAPGRGAVAAAIGRSFWAGGAAAGGVAICAPAGPNTAMAPPAIRSAGTTAAAKVLGLRTEAWTFRQGERRRLRQSRLNGAFMQQEAKKRRYQRLLFRPSNSRMNSLPVDSTIVELLSLKVLR